MEESLGGFVVVIYFPSAAECSEVDELGFERFTSFGLVCVVGYLPFTLRIDLEACYHCSISCQNYWTVGELSICLNKGTKVTACLVGLRLLVDAGPKVIDRELVCLWPLASPDVHFCCCFSSLKDDRNIGYQDRNDNSDNRSEYS